MIKKIHPNLNFILVTYSDKNECSFITRSTLGNEGKTEKKKEIFSKHPLNHPAWNRKKSNVFSHQDNSFMRHFGKMDISSFAKTIIKPQTSDSKNIVPEIKHKNTKKKK